MDGRTVVTIAGGIVLAVVTLAIVGAVLKRA